MDEHAADEVHERLGKAVEKRQKSYLWTPTDMVTFTPRLLPVYYGDGRALFTLATINQRPRYWIIRGCSTWGSGLDSKNSEGPDISEFIDDIMTALEEAFGSGRCGYSGNSLFWPRQERLRNCRCEECDERGWQAKWPMVDGYGGCSWSRIDWPKDFDTEPNPLSQHGNILRAKEKDQSHDD